jgi:hypothetical protein
MTDEAQAETKQPLPYGAKEIHLGSSGYSAALAERLAESGASDAAIDAAGGPGTADRLHHAGGTPTRHASGGPAAALGTRREG